MLCSYYREGGAVLKSLGMLFDLGTFISVIHFMFNVYIFVAVIFSFLLS